MSKRLDVLYPHEILVENQPSKTAWYRCGSAFENANGDITVFLVTVPHQPNGRGEIKLMLREARENNDRGNQDRGNTGQGDRGGMGF